MRDKTRAEAAPALPNPMCATAVDAIDELPLPYVEMDAAGIITRANHASLALHSLECGQLVGRSAWDLVATDEKDMSFASYCASLEKGEASAVVYRSVFGRSGQFRTYEIHRRLVRNGEGSPAGMRMLCVDVTDAKKELEDARRRSSWLENVMDAIGVAVVVTDAVGFIRGANPAAEALLGWKASELKDMTIEAGLPMVAYRSGAQTELLFTTALEGPTKGTATVLDRNRRELKIDIETSPIFDRETGSTAGIVVVLRETETPL